MFIPSWGRTHFDISSTTRLNHLGCISILNMTNCLCHLCPFRKGCFLWWCLLKFSHKVNITATKSLFLLDKYFVGFIFSNHMTIICKHVCAFRILQSVLGLWGWMNPQNPLYYGFPKLWSRSKTMNECIPCAFGAKIILPETNSLPLDNRPGPKRKGLSPNHQFSGTSC